MTLMTHEEYVSPVELCVAVILPLQPQLLCSIWQQHSPLGAVIQYGVGIERPIAIVNTDLDNLQKDTAILCGSV